MALEEERDVLYTRTNHVTYVIGTLCTCLLEIIAMLFNDFVTFVILTWV